MDSQQIEICKEIIWVARKCLASQEIYIAEFLKKYGILNKRVNFDQKCVHFAENFLPTKILSWIKDPREPPLYLFLNYGKVWDSWKQVNFRQKSVIFAKKKTFCQP